MLKETFTSRKEIDTYLAEQKVRAEKGYLTRSERETLKKLNADPKIYIKEEKVLPAGLPIVTNRAELSKPCTEATKEEAQHIIKELETTFEHHKTRAWGLAGNQIGFDKSVAIIRIPKEKGVFALNLVNPKITQYEDPFKMSESCLSFEGIIVETQRYNQIELINYENNEEKKFWLFGQEAVAVQHEVDHLQGIVLFQRKWKVR